MGISFHMVHVNLNVLNLNRSIAFYQEALGLKVVCKKDDQEGNFKLVFLEDSKSGFRIELTWLAHRTLPYNLGDNETHIAFITSEYENAYRHHKAMGIICYENEVMGIYFISDPDGYWIEIIPAKC